MPKELTQGPEPYCMPNCQFMKLSVETEYTFDPPDYTTTVKNKLYCEHAGVCAKWNLKVHEASPYWMQDKK